MSASPTVWDLAHVSAQQPRIAQVVGGIVPNEILISRLLRVSLEGLEQMFCAERRGFPFTLKRTARGPVEPAGESARYGAIVLLGARWLEEPLQRRVFGGESAHEFAGRLAEKARPSGNLGDLSLLAWACAELAHPSAEGLLEWARDVAGARSRVYTVELAWLLSALVAAREQLDVKDSAREICARLLGAFSREAGVFPHTVGENDDSLRAHVACFADQVYPIQALARYHSAFADASALSAAERCATQICALQGPQGQWWWHYDARSGAVIEGYPVYSVHQDAMAPMALFDLAEAGGSDRSDAIRRGLLWMQEAPEVGRSLIDESHCAIWRKVGRAEPGKLVRSVRALSSRVHAGLRLGFLDGLFPARRIDFECRPYHLGWILHAWLGSL